MERLATRVIDVPNGCWPDDFAPARARTGALTSTIPAPIVGYFGALEAWFDAPLVLEIARRRPEWSVVLIGYAHDDLIALADSVPNLHLLGLIPYEELAAPLGDFDVAIVPFVVNELSAATDPVKVYEYFAAGKPVVATPMPELARFEGLLTIASSADEFVTAIEKYLDDPEDTGRRRAVASDASWDRRVDLFYDTLSDLERSSR